MKLVLIRHLMTEWNQLGLLQGKRDLPILPLSSHDKAIIDTRQAMLTEKYGQFPLILTSALQRTQQTALAYGYHTYQIDSLLNELDFGQYEGKLKQELVEKHGELWFDNPEELVLGERLLDFKERINRFISQYSQHQQILAFCHGSWMRAAYSLIQCGDLSQMNKISIHNNQILELDTHNRKGFLHE